MKKIIMLMMMATLAIADDNHYSDTPSRLAAILPDALMQDTGKSNALVKAVKDFAVLPDNEDGDAVAKANIKPTKLQEKADKTKKKTLAVYSFRKAYGIKEDVSEVVQDADVQKFKQTLLDAGIKEADMVVMRYKGQLLNYLPELEEVPTEEVLTEEKK